jgi:hypothetical protein
MPRKKQSKSKAKTKSASKARVRGAEARTPKAPAKQERSPRKAAAKPASSRRKRKPSVSAEKEIRRELQSRNRTSVGTGSSRRSADFEGLSRAEDVDSESVDELVEEGNVFEAGAVAGVEEADDSDEREVHTHEVPEDDVPEEYLDKD